MIRVEEYRFSYPHTGHPITLLTFFLVVPMCIIKSMLEISQYTLEPIQIKNVPVLLRL